jgi:hypothetical protein
MSNSPNLSGLQFFRYLRACISTFAGWNEMEGSRFKGFSKPKMENQFMLYNEDIYTEQWGH